MNESVPQNTESIESRINTLLESMTLDEKIGQTAMRGTSSREDGDFSETLLNSVKAGRVGAFLNINETDNVDMLQKLAVEDSKHGIPLIFARDVIHGYKTIFPIPLAIAASWNQENARIGARVSAEEATTNGIRWTFAPMMDIARDARWGRIAESFGEDPYLSSEMAVAMVNGFQTDDLSDPTAMAACAKHFVGYGAAEGGRDYNTTPIPPRELRDVYLKPFKAVADAGCATMMTAFNDIDGIPASGHQEMLTKVLRDEWNWDGFLVSDWASITEMIAHGFAGDEKEAALRAFNAGLNMEMATDAYAENLNDLINNGLIKESWLDEMVRQILRIKFRLGLFETPYCDRSRAGQVLGAESLLKAKQAATESVVMLKNDKNLLPLAKTGRRYAVIGPMADAAHEQLGTWIFDGDAKNSVTPLAAIRKLIGQDSVKYAPGLTHARDRSTDGFANAISVAEASDIVMLFVGEEAIMSGEAHSLSDIGFHGAQNELIEEITALGKPTVLVVMSGRPNAIQQHISQSDAVLIAFHGGTMAGPALADLLFGEVSPSGRLPVSWPITTGQTPIHYNHKNTGRPAKDETYVPLNDIPVQAWQSSLGNESHYLDVGFRPAYPFGFGLTYSQFEYKDLELSDSTMVLGESLTASASIQNTGNSTATEVAQLYVRDLVGDVTRPIRELKGFERVTLSPGEKKIVTFKLHTNDLSFHNIAMEEVTEPGEFHVWIAPNAVEGLKGKFSVVER